MPQCFLFTCCASLASTKCVTGTAPVRALHASCMGSCSTAEELAGYNNRERLKQEDGRKIVCKRWLAASRKRVKQQGWARSQQPGTVARKITRGSCCWESHALALQPLQQQAEDAHGRVDIVERIRVLLALGKGAPHGWRAASQLPRQKNKYGNPISSMAATHACREWQPSRALHWHALYSAALLGGNNSRAC